MLLKAMTTIAFPNNYKHQIAINTKKWMVFIR